MITAKFVLAGKAIFTVHNDKDEHYTYKVTKKTDKSDERKFVYFVTLLTGPDNNSNYTYIGMLNDMNLRLTKKSKLTDDSKPIKVLRWALKQVQNEKELPQGYGIHHENHCGRCGRKLTVPAGINPEGYRFGFGPECWGKEMDTKS